MTKVGPGLKDHIYENYLQVKMIWVYNRSIIYTAYFFTKMGQSRSLFVYFRLFYMTQIKYKLIKALMVCLGLEPEDGRYTRIH